MADEVLRLTRKVSVDGTAHYNVFHFRNTDYIGDEPEAALYAAFQSGSLTNSVHSKMREAMDGGGVVVDIGVSIQQILPVLKDPEEFPLPQYDYTEAGGLPSFVAAVHNVRTGLGGRSRRGRFYVGALEDADTLNNSLSVGGLAKQENIDTQIASDFIEGGATYKGFAFGVYSRKLNEFFPATEVSTSSVLAVLRRRKVGRGI